MLRVHFTATDLLDTRFSAQPAPMMELMAAIAMLQRRDPLFDGWRRSCAAQLPRAARPLFELVPASGKGPLFLDPISDGLADGINQVLSSPRSFVRSELNRVFDGKRPDTGWLRGLGELDGDAWRVLAEAIRAAHASVLAPSWSRVQAGFRAEIAMRGRLAAESGMRTVLLTLYPGSSWCGSILQIPRTTSLDLCPAGRGVTLLPSVFWTGAPLVSRHPDGSALILYPACMPLPLTAADATSDSLSRLIGHTRAAILALAAAGRTTTGLARELGISAATVSVHTKTLRVAGLLVTMRDGKAVVHSLTPLGQRLLTG
jgi:DNA-binding transcriptional ArsR family regulator